jgi:hypothetical protein
MPVILLDGFWAPFSSYDEGVMLGKEVLESGDGY